MISRHDAHGYWLREAGRPKAAAPLDGDQDADVVVIGGGYTGLWTAWHVKRLEPEARVVLLEAESCGEGPSGRNAGFCNSMWFHLPAIRERFGDHAGTEFARAAQASVHEVGRFCEEQEVDAWFRLGGYLQVSTAPAYDGSWEPYAQACRELGEPDACVPLSPEEIRSRCASPIFRAGALYPGSATVHPARLAQGLRLRALDAGVAIHENSPALALRQEVGATAVDAGGGTARAPHVVLAAGARAGTLVGGLRRRLTVTSSHMVITEPVPDLLEEVGWTGGECITDSRALLHYFRTTPDGRIAFGWGGGRVVPGTRLNGRAELDRSLAGEVADHLVRFFPQLRGRRIDHAWGGPIDVSPTRLPIVGSPSPGLHYAFGYTGNGVGPCQLAGRILASLALDRRDEPTRLPIVDPPTVKVPPEPFRYVGGAIVRRAMVRRESAEELDERPGALSSFVAGIPERIGIHVGR
jgi:glycine/D-amino acid oxidase-like deaminating enzyme